MHLTVHHATTIANDSYHNAFTDLAWWRGQWFCGYRVAASHDIVPPGTVHIRRLDRTQDGLVARGHAHIRHPVGDVRDPRFVASADALYCLVGVYLPNPASQAQGLSEQSYQNILQTHLTYTTDGRTWAPLRPIGRPNAWIWHAIHGPHAFYAAAYHVGSTPYEPLRIVLYGGRTLQRLTPITTIYDCAHRDCAYALPCEPVLYRPAPDTLACVIRTEEQAQVGVAPARDLTDWRWAPLRTRDTLHPSAVVRTKDGFVMAARWLRRRKIGREQRLETGAGIYRLAEREAEALLMLPGSGRAGDCGYCGLDKEGISDTLCVSWYDQAETLRAGAYGGTLPCSSVTVATLAQQ